MTKVKFTFARHWRSYNAGDEAAFEETIAKAMASKGLGKVSTIQADPVQATKAPNKTVPKVLVTKSE